MITLAQAPQAVVPHDGGKNLVINAGIFDRAFFGADDLDDVSR